MRDASRKESAGRAGLSSGTEEEREERLRERAAEIADQKVDPEHSTMMSAKCEVLNAECEMRNTSH